MSSGASYGWADAQAEERRQQAALHAELERLRVRQRQLNRLRVALASQGIRAASVAVADVEADADSTQLRVAVTEARAGLDALENRLTEAVENRSRDRAARWAATTVTTAGTAPEASLSAALGQERARAAAATVEPLARAATELVETEGPRCASAELADLVRRAELVGGLDPVRARRALTDLESRVASSIRLRRDRDRAEQLRHELLTLAGELPTGQRAAMRERITGTGDADLAPVGDEVRAAVDAWHRDRSRAEVTERVLAALREQGYEPGEPFDDLLTAEPSVTLLTSAKNPAYGIRLVVDRDRFQATTVRRDDVGDASGDRQAQRTLCDDLDLIETGLAGDGVRLRTLLRRPVRDRVPTMPARHWPKASGERKATAHRTGRQEKGRAS